MRRNHSNHELLLALALAAAGAACSSDAAEQAPGTGNAASDSQDLDSEDTGPPGDITARDRADSVLGAGTVEVLASGTLPGLACLGQQLMLTKVTDTRIYRSDVDWTRYVQADLRGVEGAAPDLEAYGSACWRLGAGIHPPVIPLATDVTAVLRNCSDGSFAATYDVSLGSSSGFSGDTQFIGVNPDRGLVRWVNAVCGVEEGASNALRCVESASPWGLLLQADVLTLQQSIAPRLVAAGPLLAVGDSLWAWPPSSIGGGAAPLRVSPVVGSAERSDRGVVGLTSPGADTELLGAQIGLDGSVETVTLDSFGPDSLAQTQMALDMAGEDIFYMRGSATLARLHWPAAAQTPGVPETVVTGVEDVRFIVTPGRRALALVLRAPQADAGSRELILVDMDRDLLLQAWQGPGLDETLGNHALVDSGERLVFEVDMGGLVGGRLLAALDTVEGGLTELGTLPPDVGSWSSVPESGTLVMAGGLPTFHGSSDAMLEYTSITYRETRLVAASPGLQAELGDLGRVLFPIQPCGSCLFAQRESLEPGDTLLEVIRLCEGY